MEKTENVFPDDVNGSRIILTTRNVDVAKYANPNNSPCELGLMNKETSWDLLSKKVFLKDSCPEELVPIGNSIALKCHGLPLSINLVAGHLSQVGRTSLDWLNLERQLPSLQENGLDILALSYNFLPAHLKKCLIFAANEYTEFSMTPHGRKLYQKLGIPTKKLMNLWISAGYINAESPRSLEDVADECLQELTSRNVLMITNRGSNSRPKSYIVHDLMIDMCRRMDDEQVRRSGSYIDNSFDADRWIRSASYEDDEYNENYDLSGVPRFGGWSGGSDSDTNTYTYSHGIYPFALFGCNEYISDKLLQSIDEDFSVLKRSHLKHLEISTRSTIPTSVNKLCNLQTLISRQVFLVENLPRDIWMMSQLRHLHVGDITYLPSPRQLHTQDFGIPILRNLVTVTLSSASCTREICEGIPNLRRLKLYEIGAECNSVNQSLNCLNNLFFLAHLQNLKLSLRTPPRCLQHWRNPPPCLRKLRLTGGCLAREDISMLASLPNLEVLKLKTIKADEFVLDFSGDIFHKLGWFRQLVSPYMES